MAENKGKKQAADKENGRDKDSSAADKASKSLDVFSITADDKTLPFFDAGEEEFLKAHGLKEQDGEEDGEVKSGLTSRDIYGKWGDEPSFPTSYPTAKEKSRRDPELPEAAEHLDEEEELYRSRKHSSKKEEKAKKKEKKDKARRSPSPPAASREKERPLFPGAFPPRDGSPVRHLAASREEFELKVSSLEDLPR